MDDERPKFDLGGLVVVLLFLLVFGALVSTPIVIILEMTGTHVAFGSRVVILACACASIWWWFKHGPGSR
jgi:hypothetical protein